MRRSITSLALIATLFIPSLSYADTTTAFIPPVITPLTKGTPAPFTGILLTPEAVANVIASANECPKRIQVEVDRVQGEERAQCDKKIADAQADSKRDKAVFQAGIDQRDGTIKDLLIRLDKSEQSRGNTWLWVSGGVLGGAILATLSIVVVSAVK